MYCLSDEQIDFISNDLKARGITTSGLRDNLLDHVCILIEQNLEPGKDFERFYATLITTFYEQDLKEIEEETRFLLLTKNHLVLSKLQFFCLLLLVLIGPFIVYFIYSVMVTWPTSGWNIPRALWGRTLAYSLWPFSSILVLFLIPERFDSPIPRNSKIALGVNPFITIIR